MSRTHAIVCHDCKVSLWIGQGSDERAYIYTTEPELTALKRFLFCHARHRLEFGDDEFVGVEYRELTDSKPSP